MNNNKQQTRKCENCEAIFAPTACAAAEGGMN